MNIFKLDQVGYSYDGIKNVVNDVNYEFQKGKVYAIIGKSGAGKTTLLSMLSGLAAPTSGTIYYNDTDICKINQYDYRSKHVGVIFQSFNLLPHLTAKENVILSMDISGKEIKNKADRAHQLLSQVELAPTLHDRKILKISGGEQQRVAIARTLSYDPDVILADEPTGNLDHDTQENIMDIFCELAHEENKCVIIVTHSPDVAKRADECFEILPQKKKKAMA